MVQIAHAMRALAFVSFDHSRASFDLSVGVLFLLFDGTKTSR
jgi:hypothetical protein